MTGRAGAGSDELPGRVRTWLETLPGYTADGLLVAAVSGGVDSVVLLDLLVTTGCRVVVAHVHHGLRGAESDADEAFVRDLAERSGCPYERIDLEAGWSVSDPGRSVQETARGLRYERLAALAERLGVRFVATGHTRDDQAETVLLHLGRGAGPEGLAGMPAVRRLSEPVWLVRPLLEVSREAIERRAQERGLEWREDASNASTKYRRNAIRLKLMPAYARIAGGDVGARIAQSAGLLRAYVDTEQRPLVESLVRLASLEVGYGAIAVPLSWLRELPPVWRSRFVLEVLHRVLPGATRDRGMAARVERLARSQVGRRLPVTGGAVWRERDALVFAPDTPVPPPRRVGVPDDVEWSGDRIVLRDAPGERVTPRFEEVERGSLVVDADRALGEWILRPWMPGDRLSPVGMAGTARVKALLTNDRVPSFRRGAQAVLTAGGRVVCLVGHRVDASVAISPGTKRAVEIIRISATDPEG